MSLEKQKRIRERILASVEADILSDLREAIQAGDRSGAEKLLRERENFRPTLEKLFKPLDPKDFQD